MSTIVEMHEADLIKRVRAGDPDACEAMVRQHGGTLHAVAFRYLGNHEDCADALQDAFLAAFRSIESFSGNARLGTWLHRIVVNVCLMKLRSRRRRPTVAIEEMLPLFDETGHHTRFVAAWTIRHDDCMDREETRQHVRNCIDQLPDGYRTVLLMRDIDGFDTDETARMLGVQSGAVKTRLHRARQALRTLLSPSFQE